MRVNGERKTGNKRETKGTNEDVGRRGNEKHDYTSCKSRPPPGATFGSKHFRFCPAPSSTMVWRGNALWLRWSPVFAPSVDGVY